MTTLRTDRPVYRGRPGVSDWSFLRPVLLALVVGGATAFLFRTVGLKLLPVAIGGILGLGLLYRVSGREPAIPLAAWMAAMSGFQLVAMIRMPGLPDFSMIRLFSIWVIFMIVVRFMVLGRPLRRPWLPDTIYFLWVFYLMMHIILNQSHMFHLWTLCSLYPLVGYLFVKNFFETERSLKVLFYSLLAMQAYFVVTAIGEHFGIKQLVWPRYILDRHFGKWWEGRARGPFLQPGLFGEIMGMYSLILFYLFFRVRRLTSRLFVGTFLALSLVGVLFSFTRGAWLATAAGIGTLAVLRPNYRKAVLAGGLVLALAAAIGSLSFTKSEYMKERVENTDTIENRLGSWATSLRMIRDHPLFGVGFFRYTEYRDVYNTGTYIPFYGYVKRSMAEHVVIHDIYMGRAAEEGMVSILLLAGFTLVTFRNFRRKWRANPQEEWFNRDVLAVMAGICVVYFVDGFTYDYRYFDLINVIPLVMAAIINGYRNELYLKTP